MSEKDRAPDVGHAAASPTAKPDGGDAGLSAVSELMEERRRFEAWIAALEARRDTTPEKVYTRVHADYSARLDVVIAQLTSHTEGLRGELTGLASRLASLQERQQQVRDERAESELRAHVGELSPEDWAHTAAESDARIIALEVSHAAMEQELQRARELLIDAERPVTTGSSMAAIPEPSAAPARAASEVEVEVKVSGGAEPAAPPPAPASSAPPRTRTGSFDELAFLSSVVDTPAPPPAPSPPSRPADPGRRDSYAVRGMEDQIENLDGSSGAGLVARTGGERPLAANISGNNPIVIKDKPSEGAKSLKCAECGAMNFPTEWYCERCGAELASL